jgi:hypothetical protein
MRLVALLLVFAAIAIASSAMTGVETPEPTAPAATETPLDIETPAATETPTPSPTATMPDAEQSTPPADLPPAPFQVSGRLVEDLNATSVLDAADAPPKQVFLVLVPWSTADEIITRGASSAGVVYLYSDPDGAFAFINVPPDAYTLEIIWFAGFVTKGASAEAPTLWRAAFRVTESGDIVAPDPLPEHWPGSLVPLNPDEAHIGRPPGSILLNKIDPRASTVPVFAIGPEGPPPVGRVDVGAVLQRRAEGAVQLPSTGVSPARRDSWVRYGMLAGAAVAALAVSALLVRRRRA